MHEPTPACACEGLGDEVAGSSNSCMTRTPAIAGTDVARLPNGDVVSINAVNAVTSSASYVVNTVGSSPNKAGSPGNLRMGKWLEPWPCGTARVRPAQGHVAEVCSHRPALPTTEWDGLTTLLTTAEVSISRGQQLRVQIIIAGEGGARSREPRT